MIIKMDQAAALPDMRFKTFLTVDTLNSEPKYYTKAPMKSFRPPEEWEIDQHEFRRMIALQDGIFYDTEKSARPKSYVVVPAEMEAAVRGRTDWECLLSSITRRIPATLQGRLSTVRFECYRVMTPNVLC